eukprot:5502475-Alexandrium_andersonii.AAC.1
MRSFRGLPGAPGRFGCDAPEPRVEAPQLGLRPQGDGCGLLCGGPEPYIAGLGNLRDLALLPRAGPQSDSRTP